MEKMTIFYNKRLGIVKTTVDGEQDMSFFGNEQEDYEKIYGYIVIEQNDFMHQNLDKLIVKDGELKLNEKMLGGLL